MLKFSKDHKNTVSFLLNSNDRMLLFTSVFISLCCVFTAAFSISVGSIYRHFCCLIMCLALLLLLLLHLLLLLRHGHMEMSHGWVFWAKNIGLFISKLP